MAEVTEKMEYRVQSTSRAETVQLGVRLGALLQAGDVVCLSGDLGAGKTALTSGIVQGWGAQQAASSPTFVFVHEHTRASDSQRLFHLDCYRLTSEADALSIGLEDILAGQDVAILEWAERVESLLPPARLWITLSALASDDNDDDQRLIECVAMGERYQQLLRALMASNSAAD